MKSIPGHALHTFDRYVRYSIFFSSNANSIDNCINVTYQYFIIYICTFILCISLQEQWGDFYAEFCIIVLLCYLYKLIYYHNHECLLMNLHVSCRNRFIFFKLVKDFCFFYCSEENWFFRWDNHHCGEWNIFIVFNFTCECLNYCTLDLTLKAEKLVICIFLLS